MLPSRGAAIALWKGFCFQLLNVALTSFMRVPGNVLLRRPGPLEHAEAVGGGGRLQLIRMRCVHAYRQLGALRLWALRVATMNDGCYKGERLDAATARGVLRA